MSRMVRLIFPLFLVAGNCVAQPAPSRPVEQYVAPVKLVAVMDFDHRAVEQSAASIYGSQQDIGKGLSKLLAQKLMQDGYFQVVDRATIEPLLAQQPFPVRSRTDTIAMAKLGKALGLDAVIVGSVIKFDRKETRGAKDMALGSRALAEARLKKSEWKAVCVITARLVDTNTGETLASATSEGSSERTGSSLLDKALLRSSREIDAAGFNVREPGFDQTLLGEAATKAIMNLSSQLEARVFELPNHLHEISGLVADVSDNMLTVTLGARSGLKAGDRLEIVRILRLVVDPKTGKPLRTITEKIGDGIITEMNMEYTTLAFSGNSPAKIGDIAQLHSGRSTNHALARNTAGAGVAAEANSGTESAADPTANSNGHVSYAPH